MKRKDKDLRIIYVLKRRLQYRLRKRFKKRVRNFPRFQLTTPTFVIRKTVEKFLTKLFILYCDSSNESLQSHEYETELDDAMDIDPFPEPDDWVTFYPSPLDADTNIRLMTPKRSKYIRRENINLSYLNIRNASLYYLPELSSTESPVNPGLFFFLEDDDTLATDFSDTFKEIPFHEYRHYIFRQISYIYFMDLLYHPYSPGREYRTSLY